MDVAFVISQRLTELGLGQRDLARAARVTESYISQLLARKKLPPAPNRTDIYPKMDRVLKLPTGELARVADLQRKDQLKKAIGDQPAPLFREVRELILEKCRPDRREQVRAIFEQQPFGELERLVTQTLLQAVKRLAKAELENEDWLRTVAQLGSRSYEEMRVALLEFLDTEIFTVSVEHSLSFLEPLIRRWDIDLGTFDLEIELNQRVADDSVRRFGFRELDPAPTDDEAFETFLKDRSLSGTATENEIVFLRRLRFSHQHPTPLYYYRELQNLRDPLNFRGVSTRP